MFSMQCKVKSSSVSGSGSGIVVQCSAEFNCQVTREQSGVAHFPSGNVMVAVVVVTRVGCN